MSKRRTKIRFFTVADYIEEEKWLENQHRNGWKLVKMIPPCFFIFQECNPEEVVYKLEYKNQDVTEDYIQMYKDYGWDYVASCFGWNYFRKIEAGIFDKNEKEIFSDNESKLNMINNIFKTRMIPLLVIFCVIIIPNLCTFILGHYSLFTIVIGVIYLILFTLYVCIFAHCGFKLIKLRKELER